MSSFSTPYGVNQTKYPRRRQIPYGAGTISPGPNVKIRLLRPLPKKYLCAQDVEARLDTGATYTVLTYEQAIAWGIDPEKDGSPEIFPATLADGSTWPGRLCNLDLDVCGLTLRQVPVFVPLKKPEVPKVPPEEQTKTYLERLKRLLTCGKSPRASEEGGAAARTSLGRNLLGRKGVLNRILLCMDSEFAYLFAKSECVAGGSGEAGTSSSSSPQSGPPGSTA